MSDRGVFAVDRGIWDDPDFANEPLTEREAFLWLIAEAAWKPHRKRADGKVVDLDRGQLCHSVRFMAEAWQWSKSRVDRFLDRLENRDMIKRDHGTRTPITTICNYDRFQRVALPERDNIGTDGGTRAGQERDKLESIETSPSLRSGGESENARKPSRKADRGTKVDPGFWPNETGIAVAAEEGITGQALPREVAHFIDHHAQKGTLGKDWQAGWRTWCRSPYRKPGQSGRPPPSGPARPPSRADINMQLALEADENLRRKQNGGGPFDGEIILFGSRLAGPGSRYADAPDDECPGAGGSSYQGDPRLVRAFR